MMPSACAKHEEPDLESTLCNLVIGQESSISRIVPFIGMYEAGLNDPDRPAGIFLLLGPTGTGKTKTVEAIAEALHGSSKKLIKVDCGEFQQEHEIAKLIGAPPGYTGHREAANAKSGTPAYFTQAKLKDAVSQYSDLAVVLFDEIEKAAPSLMRLLLGVFDKGTLRLGDNSLVAFGRTLIFLTSNLGAAKMEAALKPGLGFPSPASTAPARLDRIGIEAAKRTFSPEFYNRLDAVLTYHPLNSDELLRILDLEIAAVQLRIDNSMGDRGCTLDVRPAARKWLVKNGTSREYGARELKRTAQRHIMQPLAEMINHGRISGGETVTINAKPEDAKLKFSITR